MKRGDARVARRGVVRVAVLLAACEPAAVAAGSVGTPPAMRQPAAVDPPPVAVGPPPAAVGPPAAATAPVPAGSPRGVMAPSVPWDSTVARELLTQLVAIRTVEGTRGTLEAAEAMAARLLAAGFPEEDVRVVGPEPELGNLVARYRGTGDGGSPILLMAHLDVVDARPEDWTLPPFRLTERDGWWYGRGTTDNKAGAAILVAELLRWREEGWVPSRDLIVVLTADEETTGASIDWLVTERRDLVGSPAFALNTDAGGGVLVDGEEAFLGVQASEKVYLSFRVEATDPGGHSSLPRPENAIYSLAEALTRLAEHRFPVALNEVTRVFFRRYAEVVGGPQAEDMRAVAEGPDLGAADRLARSSPYYNALLRTTCVATRLEAGHADNALPQSARAVVNCRILPGEPPEEVEAILREALADGEIRVTRIGEAVASPPSPLTPALMEAIEGVAGGMWPGVPVIPTMSTGATDGLFVRNAGIPVYGASAIFEDPDDIRAHGKDERIADRRFYEALRYLDLLVRELAGGGDGASGNDGGYPPGPDGPP